MNPFQSRKSDSLIFMAIFSRTSFEEMTIALSIEQARALYDKLDSILP